MCRSSIKYRSNSAETHVEESAKEAATTEHKQASEVPIGDGKGTGPTQKEALKWPPDDAARAEKIITQDISTPAPESFKASEMSDPSVMSALAMDQLAASSIVRDANGQIISFETDPIVPVEDKQYESSAAVFVGAPDQPNSSEYKSEMPIYESEEDESLVGAEDADENTQIPSFTTSLEGGRRYDRHPPADF